MTYSKAKRASVSSGDHAGRLRGGGFPSQCPSDHETKIYLRITGSKGLHPQKWTDFLGFHGQSSLQFKFPFKPFEIEGKKKILLMLDEKANELTETFPGGVCYRKHTFIYNHYQISGEKMDIEGSVEIQTRLNECFIFRFTTKEDRLMVLEASPRMLDGHLIVLRK